NRSGGNQGTGEAERLHDLLRPLLWSEPADVKEGESVAQGVAVPNFLAPANRIKERRVDSPTPNFHVGHLQPHQLVAGDGGRSVDPPAPAMKATEVRAHCTSQPRFSVRLGVATKVRVVGGDQGNPGPGSGQLPHSSDAEFGGAMNQIRPKALHQLMDRGRPRKDQAD